MNISQSNFLRYEKEKNNTKIFINQAKRDSWRDLCHNLINIPLGIAWSLIRGMRRIGKYIHTNNLIMV